MSPPNFCSRSSLSDASTRKILWLPRFHLRHMTLLRRRSSDSKSLRDSWTRLVQPHMGYLLKQLSRCDPHNKLTLHTAPSTSVPSAPLQPLVRLMCEYHPQWEHMLFVHQLPTKGVQVTALAGTHHAIGLHPDSTSNRESGPLILQHRTLVLPMVKFGQAKPDGPGTH